MLTDEGQGGPAAAVASLSAADEDLSSFGDVMYNRPPVVYNFSVMDLDKRYNFSTGKWMFVRLDWHSLDVTSKS